MSRPVPPEFMHWLEKRPHSDQDFVKGLDLTGVSLADLDLSSVWFAECSFDDAVVRDTDLYHCLFGGCSFRRADLTAAYIPKSRSDGSTFAHASLAGADLLRLRASETDFRHADLSRATLTRMAAVRCDLREASLQGAQFNGTTIKESLLAGADLTGATGTVNGNLSINVGAPDSPLMLTAYAAMEWMRDAGAELTWFRTPEQVAESRERTPRVTDDRPDGAAQ
jgi:hypothetical protein